MTAPRPRVLLVCPHFEPEPVAGAVRLTSFARELRALGHEVVVVAPGSAPHGGEADVRRVDVAPRGRGAVGNVAYQLRLRAALRAGARAALATFPAQVVVVSAPPPVAALAGRDVARERRLPLVLDLRDLWPDVLIEAGVIGARSPAAFVLRRVERRLLGACAAVTTASSGKIDKLASRTRRPVLLVRNGVDARWCDGEPAYEGGGAAGPFEALYAGNLGRAQDVALLARAVRETPDVPSRRALRATIVGDGESRGEIEALAADAGDRIALHPPESRVAVRARLARCGCAFVSLRSSDLADSVPSKLLEAMARGVPVVAAVAGEAAEILRDGGGGVVVPPGRMTELAEALRLLAAMTEQERRAMGARGREHVIKRYRREDAASTLSDLLGRVVAAWERA